ncbi:hypothetical protein HUJ04_006928 [Dendroctonus ponderosae]|nr:hypothetical protein HUJ04_006928 [Dendroctonus ponderosae]
MDKPLIFHIIKAVEEAGFYVCAIVSDLGGSNRGLHKNLNITFTEPWFMSPTNNHKVNDWFDCLNLCHIQTQKKGYTPMGSIWTYKMVYWRKCQIL